jgi:hypothetical protein
MTRADAIKQALQNLKVLDAISNPSAEDTVAVGTRLDQVRAELSERGLVWWDEGDIPDSVALPFCRLVAAECADVFGKTYDATGALTRIAAMKSSAERPVVKATYY